MSDVSITELKNAVATLLPCLRSQNYRERWDDRSPAVRALQALSAFVGEEVPTAGDLMDPEVATVHAKPPEAVTVPSEPSDSALWDFANDLLAAWNIEDTNEPSLTEQLRDMFVARFRLPVPVEPEWEYGKALEDGSHGNPAISDSLLVATEETDDWNRNSARLKSQGMDLGRGIVVRRVKAGPWLPVVPVSERKLE